MSRTLRFLAVMCSLSFFQGCDPKREHDAPPSRRELHVFAASSLTEAFQSLEQAFEANHPKTDVILTFSGSQVLRLQIEQGAAADLFASANQEHMDALIRAGNITVQQLLAENELVVIVPLDGSESIQTFTDLKRAEHIVLGTENVPIGIYSRRVIERAAQKLGSSFARSIQDNTVSLENNVRLVRAKVELGEADAAIVYRSDAASSTKVRVVEIPEEWNLRASYPIGLVARAKNEEDARAFLAFTRSETAGRILENTGFLRTPTPRAAVP